MTTIDVPLLRKVLEHVTEHPEEWRQAYWITGNLVVDGRTYTGNEGLRRWYALEDAGMEDRATWCGTTACLAGHVAVTVLGGVPHFSGGPTVTSYVKLDGEVQYVQDVAQKALGLNSDQADRLFSAGNNSLGDLWRIAHDITRGEIEVPLQFA